jgi:hypothetical protein
MENIITLIVVIIVFNLISSVLRSIRGGQAPPPKRIQDTVPDQAAKAKTIDPWVDEDLSGYSSHGVVDPGPEEYNQYESKEDGEESKTVTTQKSRPAPVFAKKSCRPPSVASGLQQVLTRKDPLVAAFIFHELFGPPAALRRKR